jgi:hypothetical protein
MEACKTNETDQDSYSVIISEDNVVQLPPQRDALNGIHLLDIARPSSFHVGEPETFKSTNTDPKSPLGGLQSASLIHTTKLPTTDTSLDLSLARYNTDISPWTEPVKPVKWIQAESNYVHTIVTSLSAIIESDDIQQSGVAGQVIVYPVSVRVKLHTIELIV